MPANRYEEIPLIPLPALARAAGVSRDTGDRRATELEAAGQIQPTRSPTGRVTLSARDGRRVFDAILKG